MMDSSKAQRAGRTPWLLWSLVAVLLCMACDTGSGDGGAAAPSDAEDRPNVLFVFYDQFRADLIGAYGGLGNIETPNFDRLAREGTLVTDGLSTVPVSGPYRGMLMTGRVPTHTGMLVNLVEANTSSTSFADVFAAAGYRTAFMGKWMLAAGSHKTAWVGGLADSSMAVIEAYMSTNPDYDYVPPGAARMGFQDWAAYNFHMEFMAAPFYGEGPERRTMDGFETDALTGMAIEYMAESEASGEPFFLMVAPHPPHPPFDVLPEGYLEQVPETLRWEANVPPELRVGRYLDDARGYYAMAKNVDDNVGRILSYLDASGLAENTIVVFTSDHGEMLGSHGLRDKMVPYRESVRVPVLVRWPGHVPAGGNVEVLFTPADHMPTIIALAGLSPPEGLDGLDLSGAFLGGQTPERDAALMGNYTTQYDFLTTYTQPGSLWPEWRAVKTKRYTYVRWMDGSVELYDDLADPGQSVNLAEDPAQSVTREELEATLLRLLAEAHDDFRPGNAYAEWFDAERNIVRTGLGPVER